METTSKKDNILVFGPPGSGKSFLVAKLKKNNKNIIDADQIKGLIKNIDGEVVWDENILKKYLSDKQGLYFFGIASNTPALMANFDDVFYLKVSSEILKKRLASSSRKNPSGKNKQAREDFVNYAKYLDQKVAELNIKIINGDLSPQQILARLKNYRLLKNEQVMSKGKYWLRLSFVCNNNCLFCLDKKNQLGNSSRELDEIYKEVEQASDAGFNQIILSGGEATIHPDFFEIVKYCREKDFSKIQVITNGRMFAYEKFTRQAIKNGLNEITFSIHGVDSRTHDKLVRVDGAFEQAVKGIFNLKKFNNIVVNIDIVINKINLEQIIEIIKFFSDKYSIFEYDLLYLVPFGNANDNLEDLKIDFFEFKKYFQPILDLAKNDKRYHIWTNRLPANYLEDYEFLIQDPHKILDEVRGRQEVLNNYLKLGQKPDCYDEARCANCFLNDFCLKIEELRENKEELKNNIIKLDKNNFDQEMSKDKIYTLETFSYFKDLIDQGVDLPELIKKLTDQDLNFINLPFCLISENSQTEYDCFFEQKEFDDIFDFGKYYIKNCYFLKSLRCKDCIHNSRCQGLHINYLRLYGFELLKPIK